MAEALACLLGLILLARSSDVLVLGCSRLPERAGVPAVVVGVVVIGFGRSTPELLVSGSAAAAGSTAIGVGNVIGLALQGGISRPEAFGLLAGLAGCLLLLVWWATADSQEVAGGTSLPELLTVAQAARQARATWWWAT